MEQHTVKVEVAIVPMRAPMVYRPALSGPPTATLCGSVLPILVMLSVYAGVELDV